MKKSMMPLEVSTTEEGDIRIEQSMGGAEIIIHPDQVPLFKKWLDEAVSEIDSKQNHS